MGRPSLLAHVGELVVKAAESLTFYGSHIGPADGNFQGTMGSRLDYKYGWRLSEIAKLTWSQVDRTSGIVRLEVGETKNNEARTVYLDEELKAIYERQWELRKETMKLLPFVFRNRTGTDRIKRFDKVWEKACRDAKIGVRIFHDLRRTAVRNLVRSGVPERVAMMLSGHKTRSVFDRYNIVNDEDLKMAMLKQEEYLRSQMGTKTGTIHSIDEKVKKEQSINKLK